MNIAAAVKIELDASLDMLPEVVVMLKYANVEVLFAFGIGNGTDFFKAWVFGAEMLFIGPPYSCIYA